jgi:hypothetical protein
MGYGARKIKKNLLRVRPSLVTPVSILLSILDIVSVCRGRVTAWTLVYGIDGLRASRPQQDPMRQPKYDGAVPRQLEADVRLRPISDGRTLSEAAPVGGSRKGGEGPFEAVALTARLRKYRSSADGLTNGSKSTQKTEARVCQMIERP